MAVITPNPWASHGICSSSGDIFPSSDLSVQRGPWKVKNISQYYWLNWYCNTWGWTSKQLTDAPVVAYLSLMVDPYACRTCSYCLWTSTDWIWAPRLAWSFVSHGRLWLIWPARPGAGCHANCWLKSHRRFYNLLFLIVAVTLHLAQWVAVILDLCLYSISTDNTPSSNETIGNFHQHEYCKRNQTPVGREQQDESRWHQPPLPKPSFQPEDPTFCAQWEPSGCKNSFLMTFLYL